MSQISKTLRDVENNGLSFWCPGCKQRHTIYHSEGNGERWGWNHDVDKPTFSPSILVKSSKFTEQGEKEMQDWIDANYPTLEKSIDSVPTICHSFITDGRIQFLGDCTHKLANQTVDLPDWSY